MTKEQMREGIKANMSEFLMAAEVIGELLEENEELIINVFLPISKQINTLLGESITGMMNPLYKERVACIIESIDALEKAGFTREQAIQLMKNN